MLGFGLFQSAKEFLRRVFVALTLFSLFQCSQSSYTPPDMLPLFPLSALNTKGVTGISGTVFVYSLADELLLQETLIFTADTIYTPTLTLPKNETYRLVAVFYYDDVLPIAFLDEDITVGALDSYSFSMHEENLYFTMQDISDPNVLLSLSEDVKEGLLPDLDLDDDGFSNDAERRGGSDAYSDESAPAGPAFSDIEVESAKDGNSITLTTTLTDGNRVLSVTPEVTDYSYLADGGIFTTNLSGDALDVERTYTLSFNPQYAPIGPLRIQFTATNSLGMTTTAKRTVTITDNGVNVGPVIVFDGIAEGDVVTGEVAIHLTAYDRDDVATLEFSPSQVTDTDTANDIFLGTWNTLHQDDGTVTIKATATDTLGAEETRSLSVTITNGTDVTGPNLQMEVFSLEGDAIDYATETIHGTVDIILSANDAGSIDKIQLTNKSSLNCGPSDFTSCPFVDTTFEAASSSYNNSFDSTQLADGETVELKFQAMDDHGNTTEKTFTLTIKNKPTIDSVTQSGTLVANQESVTVSWDVESRTTEVIILDANNTPVTCSNAATSFADQSCEFTPLASQVYTLQAIYTTKNKNNQNTQASTSYPLTHISVDYDGDGIANESDNCYQTQNNDQANKDNDEYGDVCDPDKDGDGYIESNFAFSTFYENYVGILTTEQTEITEDNEHYAALYTNTNYPTQSDCDDSTNQIHPNQFEKINGIDDDCSRTENPSEDISDIINFSDDIFTEINDDNPFTSWVGASAEGRGEHVGAEIIQIADLNLDNDAIGELMVISRSKSYVNPTSGTFNIIEGTAYILLSETYLSNAQEWMLTNDSSIANIAQVSDYTLELDSGDGGRLAHVRTLDFDGDGAQDLLIAEPDAQRPDETRVNIQRRPYCAGRMTIIFDLEQELRLTAEDRRLSLKEYLPSKEGSRTNQSLVFYGGYENSDDGSGYDFFGYAVDVADYNADGSDDILVGMPGYYRSSGNAFDTDDIPQKYRRLGKGFAFLIEGLRDEYCATEENPESTCTGHTESLTCNDQCEFQINPLDYGRVNLVTEASDTSTAGESDYTASNIYTFWGGAVGDRLGEQVLFINDLESDTDNNMEILIGAPGYDGENDEGATDTNEISTANSGAVVLFLSGDLIEEQALTAEDYNLETSAYTIDDSNSAALVINGDYGSDSEDIYDISLRNYSEVGNGDNLGGLYWNDDYTYKIGQTLAQDKNGNIFIGAPNAKASADMSEPKVYLTSGEGLYQHRDFTSVPISELAQAIWSESTDNGFGNTIALCDDFDQTTSSDEQFLVTSGFLESWVGVYPYGVVGNGATASIAKPILDSYDYQFGSAISCIDLDGDGKNTDLIIGAWGKPGSTEYELGNFYLLPNDYE